MNTNNRSVTAERKRRRGQFAAVIAIACISVNWPAWNLTALPPETATEAATETSSGTSSAPETGADTDAAEHLAASPAEARVRAQLLHEMIHGALQVMHRDFFHKDESLTLPSRSLEDVFAAMADRWNVEIRWLTVNAEPMNVDHNPQDEFERRAVKALAAGEEQFDAVEGDRYRYAGTIRLGSQCLQCHVPKRTTLEDRAAGLAITMPFKNE